MEITIKGSAKEIADLVVSVQNRQQVTHNLPIEIIPSVISEAIRHYSTIRDSDREAQ